MNRRPDISIFEKTGIILRTQAKRNCRIRVIFLLPAAAFIIGFFSCRDSSRRYPDLWSYIQKNQWIDIHSHPAAGHYDYPAGDPYPTLEPPIYRPYWVPEPGRIAVFDFYQPQALKEIYGYEGESPDEDDMNRLRKLSQDFWSAGGQQGLNRVLDICGIKKSFANSSRRDQEWDPERILWVPFVDLLFYPFPGDSWTEIGERLRSNLNSYSRRINELAQNNSASLDTLEHYLNFADQVLADYKKSGAAALKTASAYFRTLWFDACSRDKARKYYLLGREGRLQDYASYKRLQDFLARYIFFRAGEMKLPVHVHTGFGADAGLRNLDSHPLNLESVLSDMRFAETRFVMLHAGYPFWDDIKPALEKRNVFVDFSAVNWMVFEDELSDILYNWLRYPGLSEKIMFGSDAGAPVFFWIAARSSRRALHRALSRMMDTGRITLSQAKGIADKIMRSNAEKVHGLKK